MNLTIRAASLDDFEELQRLITASARGLGRGDYTSEQIETALGSAWGIDTQLIRDQTYFVVVENGVIVACGGWSKRKALFGADARARAEPELLDPSCDAARIRAFFVHPGWVRRGIGTLLLKKCESEARAAGFHCTELVATLPGQRLYERFGYRSMAAREYPLRDQLTITFVPMRKEQLD
jgi:GNAT superfamily N-acetyltransferase